VKEARVNIYKIPLSRAHDFSRLLLAMSGFYSHAEDFFVVFKMSTQGLRNPAVLFSLYFLKEHMLA
jgi:hypothetical protein